MPADMDKTKTTRKQKAQVKKLIASILPAEPKAKVKAVKAPKTAAQPLAIVIDHPQNGEKLQSHHYAIRIGAQGGENVQISFDGGDWMHCRHNSGYYWFDWHQIPAGSHKITARMTVNGKVKKSKIVAVQVY